MCGRISNPRATQLFADRLGMQQHQLAGTSLHGGYNVPPGTHLPVFQRGDGGDWLIYGYHWGMQARVGGAWRHIINAKCERLESSGLWRHAMRQGRRGLLPVDGFFEWQRTEGGGKQPFYITRRDREPMALATLYGQAPTRAGDNKKWSACVIVTQPADGPMATLHGRMPLAIPFSRLEDWLNADSQGQVDGLVGTSDDWEWWPVSQAVNRPANDDESLLHPVE